MNAEQSSSRRRYQGGVLSTIINPKQTQNNFALIELNLPAGAEPPPHIHQFEDEAFYVIEGKLRICIGDKQKILQSGDGIFAPRNVPHSFQILSGHARFLNLISPGNLWDYFIEFSVPITDSNPSDGNEDSSPDLQRMLEVITRKYGVQFLIPG